jgi:erythrin-vacuolar iron transport family protein
MSSQVDTQSAAFAAALALQEEHGRAYAALADRIRAESPETASILLTMRQRQSAQLRQLMCVYGLSSRAALAKTVENDNRHGDEEAAKRSASNSADDPHVKRKLFVLHVVQPALAGLMDGSVSTLAPVFAAAFATRNSFTAFVIGLAASVGAGISMGFSEALSDDGVISGRGQPWLRGSVCGVMTFLGGIGHTLPFLISQFYIATWIAVAVVAIELAAIAWIRKRYMDTPLLKALFQAVIGGILVFLTGILLGSVG